MSSKIKAAVVWGVLIVVALGIGVVVPVVGQGLVGRPAVSPIEMPEEWPAVSLIDLPEEWPAMLAFESPIEPPGDWPPVPDVDTGGLEDYVAAMGLGAIITVVIEILKRLTVIPDGQAGRWATIANVLAYAALVIAGIFGIDYSGDKARAIFDLLHQIGLIVLAIISSPIFFRLLRQMNVLPELPQRRM